MMLSLTIIAAYFVSSHWFPELLRGAAELLVESVRGPLQGGGVGTAQCVAQTLFFCFLAFSCAVLTCRDEEANLVTLVCIFCVDLLKILVLWDGGIVDNRAE
jgi:hypothetical protein